MAAYFGADRWIRRMDCVAWVAPGRCNRLAIPAKMKNSGPIETHARPQIQLAVWLVQGGYAGWIAWQWVRAGKDLQADLSLNTGEDEEF